MSHFTRLQLIQFRNYRQAAFEFKQRIIGIAGPNGSGKTNLLDGIYYLCLTRSYFSRPDSKNALHGQTGFRLEGDVRIAPGFDLTGTDDEVSSIICIVRPGDKKEFLFDQVAYERFSEHMGRLPVVMIAPDDSTLITGGSEERRKFIDTILSQTDRTYLQNLIQYNKVLQQRNALLKSNPGSGQTDSLLSVLDQQLVHFAVPLFETRKAFLADFIPMVLEGYTNIAGKPESVTLSYDSHLLTHDLATLLKETLQRDLTLQRTTRGIHRDELTMQLEALPFKSLASQGQRKSLLFALKLASYYYIAAKKSTPPILLLDDVFEKLDADRMLNLLKQVAGGLQGQVFITDTHSDRLQTAFEELGQRCQLIELTADNEAVHKA